MTLRKITIDNNVRKIPQKEQTQERNFKPNTIKNRIQNKNISKNNKKFLKDTITGGDFRKLN